MTMDRRRFNRSALATTLAVSIPFLGGCTLKKKGKPQTDEELKGMGYIVTVDPTEVSENVRSVVGITDAGNRIITTGFGRAGSLSSYGGGTRMSFPRWVRVTYRELYKPEELGPRDDPWTTGKMVGDYHVEILSRIPEDVFEYASSKTGRAIRLKFRIKDDGVQFGWDVQEMDLVRKSLDYAMAGGDFLDENAGPFANKKNKAM